MRTDYSYCLNDDTCKYRGICKRWVGNYSEQEAIELSNNYYATYIDDNECLNSDIPFKLLDKFPKD